MVAKHCASCCQDVKGGARYKPLKFNGDLAEGEGKG